MIAYNPLWLSNLFVREHAAESFHQNCLDAGEWDHIQREYPVHFYSPNLFIRIGLFILTTVILLFTFGLLVLLFLNSIDNAIGGLSVFFAVISYAALEYMVQTKKHLQSGVDDALLWVSACSLCGGIIYLTNAGELAVCMIIFIISFFYSLRFGDRVMSFVLYFSMLGILFFGAAKLGTIAKTVLPFVVMSVSVIIYLLEKRTKQFKINLLYSNCLEIISLSALLSFYLAGNYFIVRELTVAMYNLNIGENQGLPLGWLFWLFTVVIPFLYILRGVQKKDIVLIRVGLLLIAAIIVTVRYYYPIASIEVIMTSAGIVLIVVSYGLTRYLRSPKYGFINMETTTNDATDKMQIESLLQAQTFTRQSASVDGTRFGGGGFGGGGTSGEF